ncbi:MAG TPA: hypothetical protein G4N97_03895 [Thermoflexia bacterium]|nr:hypothetical protein [Thermoflexia bacterium]
MEAYRNGVLVPGYVFAKPLTVTIHYSDEDVAEVSEDALGLYYWDGAAWVDAACGPYDRHTDANWLSVPVCHLTEFALLGSSSTLPVGGVTEPPGVAGMTWPWVARGVALIIVVVTIVALGKRRRRCTAGP